MTFNNICGLLNPHNKVDAVSWVTLCFNKSVQWRSYLFALASPGEFTSKSKEKLDFQTFDLQGRQESESGIRATILQHKKNTVNTLDQVVFQLPITTHNRDIVKDGFRRNTPLVHQHLKRLWRHQRFSRVGQTLF